MIMKMTSIKLEKKTRRASMKIYRKILSIVGLFALCTALQAEGDVVSQSFISTGVVPVPRPLEYRNFWQKDDVPCGKQYNFTTSIVGGSSTNSDGLRNYFSPFARQTLRVKEQEASLLGAAANVTGVTQDILSWNFNLSTANGDFDETLTFTPKRSTFGIDFDWFLQGCCKRWLRITTQILHVRTDMHLYENITNSGGGAPGVFEMGPAINPIPAVGSMKDAFKQSEMLFGKIDGPRKKTGLADIHVSFGYNWKRTGNFYAQPYAGFVIPTGNKPKAEYMFEPIVGNNKHWAVLFGSYYGGVLKEQNGRTFFFSGNAEALYRFSNTQVRSFDPSGKPWGRYLFLYLNAADMAADTRSFGINSFTKSVKVNPYFTYTSDLQVHALSDCVNFHCGYRLTVQNAEEVSLNEVWGNPAIGALDAGGGFTMPTRQINTAPFNEVPHNFVGLVPGANTFVPVLEGDLNLNSAAQPYNAQNKLFGSISKNFYPTLADLQTNLGFAYNAASSNRALSYWELWASLRAEF